MIYFWSGTGISWAEHSMGLPIVGHCRAAASGQCRGLVRDRRTTTGPRRGLVDQDTRGGSEDENARLQAGC